MKVVIFGASGYGGAELIRSILAHPQLELVGASANSNVGLGVGDLYPHLSFSEVSEMTFVSNDDLIQSIGRGGVDVAFLAMPNGQAMEVVPKVINSLRLVVDLSADFRLKDPSLYERYYRFSHNEIALLEEAAYGLVELNRGTISSARLIASPGCYVTAVTLALYPLLELGVVERAGIVSDALSGISGAGRGANVANLFSEIDSSAFAYGIGTHRHRPEIAQNIGSDLLFTPQVVPMVRGILAKTYADFDASFLESLGVSSIDDRPNAGQISDLITHAIKDFYSTSPFVGVRPVGTSPNTKSVLGTNRVEISYFYDEVSGKVMAISALDNLVKGAAGQAIQSANVALGFDEELGLSKVSLIP
ncbi:MAG: N-acetyl-gamma-glutamyl-phosphate reductase [Actinomycetota bacterium]|nr:N-acetyl-gamma-glutamyl-phosphate reductase [Actinomycetota bacterium]